MRQVDSICVYCGSSADPKPVYVEAAQKVGRLLAHEKIKMVFGGGRVGLMGVVSDACVRAGGNVLGIMTDFLNSYEGGHTGITELQIVPTMHERKQVMFDHSDAFVVLPGGLGTLDETFEMLTWKQVGLHKKPIILVDIDQYWSGLFTTFFHHMIDQGFVRREDEALFTLVSCVDDILPAIASAPTPNKDFMAKWGQTPS
jgi:uncharacterized protein (TIGR00730 family)